PPSTSRLSTLSLHDSLPISRRRTPKEADPDTLDRPPVVFGWCCCLATNDEHVEVASHTLRYAIVVVGGDLLGDYSELFRDCSVSDRKSTRLNSSHVSISYAV